MPLPRRRSMSISYDDLERFYENRESGRATRALSV